MYVCILARMKLGPMFFGLLCIGEYSAKKIYFFPGWRKNCEKVSPYFSLSEEENCQKLHFFEKKIVKISIFLGKIVKISNFLGGKHCKNLEK